MSVDRIAELLLEQRRPAGRLSLAASRDVVDPRLNANARGAV
jgi:hypothetical protein